MTLDLKLIEDKELFDKIDQKVKVSEFIKPYLGGITSYEQLYQSIEDNFHKAKTINGKLYFSQLMVLIEKNYIIAPEIK